MRGRGRAREREREGAGKPQAELEVLVQGRGEGHERPARANLPSAPFQNLQRNAGMQPLEHDLSTDEIAFARDGFTERAQNGQ